MFMFVHTLKCLQVNLLNTFRNLNINKIWKKLDMCKSVQKKTMIYKAKFRKAFRKVTK